MQVSLVAFEIAPLAHLAFIITKVPFHDSRRHGRSPSMKWWMNELTLAVDVSFNRTSPLVEGSLRLDVLTHEVSHECRISKITKKNDATKGHLLYQRLGTILHDAEKVNRPDAR